MSEEAERTPRTVLRTAVGPAVVLPAAVEATGIPRTLPRAAGALAAAGGLARLMAVPGARALLPGRLRASGASGTSGASGAGVPAAGTERDRV